MPSILVRGLDKKIIERLKARARRNGRSLQGEAKLLIEQAAGAARIDAILERWKKELAGKKFKNSADVIRQDRE